MKSESHAIGVTVLCVLLAIYLGGFFWVRASCIYDPGSKTFLLDSVTPKGKIGWKYYRPIFWIDEKLFGEKFINVGW
ncbi:MAG: hypothetical protein WCN98_19650 [Verrucomicrobiaceae bacterium]